DFLACYKYASKWVNLFYENKDMITLHPVFFLRGNHYLLEALFYLRHYEKFKDSLIRLESITKEPWFPVDDNLEGLSFLYIYNNRFNLHFMEGSFEEGLPLIDEVVFKLKDFHDRIDEHHIMVFYYKMASMYFGAGENKKCIYYLERIIANKSLQMREDLLCFTRFLNLVAHYEDGIDYHLDILIKSTYKVLIKMEDLYEVQKEFIKFLRVVDDIYPHESKNEFINLDKKLKEIENDPYKSSAFLYLDFISWLESKIQNKPIGLIIRSKFQDDLEKSKSP